MGLAVAQFLRAANRRQHGLPVILALDFFAFALLLAAYLAVRISTPMWPRPFHFPSGLMTVAMGMFAGAVSFVVHVALKSHRSHDETMTRRMLALAIAGWSTFLFLLAMEWARLFFFEQVSLFSNPWHVAPLGVSYYGFSAWNAAHIAVGVVWISLAAWQPERWRISSLALFVDFTNGLFVLVAFLVILSATDLGGF